MILPLDLQRRLWKYWENQQGRNQPSMIFQERSGYHLPLSTDLLSMIALDLYFVAISLSILLEQISDLFPETILKGGTALKLFSYYQRTHPFSPGL